jgi:hypothetical protein
MSTDNPCTYINSGKLALHQIICSDNVLTVCVSIDRGTLEGKANVKFREQDPELADSDLKNLVAFNEQVIE